MNKPFAEVIESSLHDWVAQSWQWNQSPDYGSLVTIEQNAVIYIGIVHAVSTGSMDPTRYPFAYQKTEQELLKEQPQIFEFLKTTFSCLVLGYHQKGKIYYLSPAKPARIHSFVQPISQEINRLFFARNQYIHRIFGLAHAINTLDELLLALIAHQTQSKLLNSNKLIDFMDTYSLLTGNDYRRIKLFLQRIEQSVP